MNGKRLIISFLFTISGFLLANESAMAKTAMVQSEYRECKLKAGIDTHTNDNRLLINENGPLQVLHTRITRTVQIFKSNSIITGTFLGVCQYLRHTFYTSDPPFIPSAELLLFPHHTFW